MGPGMGWPIGRGLLFGEVEQRFAELSTTPGPSGFPERRDSLRQCAASADAQRLSGARLAAPMPPELDILLGYTAEYWWNVGRLSDPDFYNGQSAGEVGLQAPVFRLEYNY